MAPVRQASFAGGELAPTLWGRTDSARYAKGLRVCRDTIISKHGQAVSRPGTHFVGLANSNQVNISPPTAPQVLVTAGGRIRLLPFLYSPDPSTKQNYVLEFGEKYFSVWLHGQRIFNTYYNSLFGQSPYHQGDLPKIQYAQSEDVLVLTCVGYPAYQLQHIADDRWDLSAVTFDAPADPYNVLQPSFREDTRTPADANHLALPWQVVASVLYTDANGNEIESAPVKMTRAYVAGAGAWQSDVPYLTGTWVSLNFRYYQALADSTGVDPSSGSPPQWSAPQNFPPSDPADQDDARGYAGTMVVYPDAPAQYRLFNTLFGSNSFIAWRIYRGQSGVLGWVGDTTAPVFVDFGQAPDLTRQPRAGTNPFEVKNGDGTVIRTETPISVSWFEDRLVFAGTDGRPNLVAASAVGDYFNFDLPFIPADDSSIRSNLSSRTREVARWCYGKDKLFIGTDGAVWADDGSNGPLTPTSVEAHVQSAQGSAQVAPIVVGNKLLYIRDKGTAVRGIEFDFSKGSYTAEDVSFGAEHLFLGHTIVDWCYADDPWAQIWAVREDGIVLSGVWCQDDEMWAWCQHRLCVDNDGNPQQVLSVCTIPEDGYDAVYFAIADPNGNNPAWIVRMGPRLELDDEAMELEGATGGGLEYGIGMGLGETEPGSAIPVNQVGAGTPICLDAWVFAAGPFASGPTGIFTFHGINYLANRNVYIIIDGIIWTGTVASNGDVGVVTGSGTTETANNVWIGLGYLPEGELLDLAEARNKMKMVGDVSLEVKANGTINVGSNFSNLEDFAPPSGTDDDEVRGLVNGQWTKAGRCCWRQVLPLPLTMRAVTREVAVGSI